MGKTWPEMGRTILGNLSSRSRGILLRRLGGKVHASSVECEQLEEVFLLVFFILHVISLNHHVLILME